MIHFAATADTDVGTTKTTNQDSLLIKHAISPAGEVLMAIVCDGMGGLAKGELASAAVIRRFADWFDRELPNELKDPDMQVIGGKWSRLLKDLNLRIIEYAKKDGISLGTTFSGILFIDERYVIVHVGDTRVYSIGEELRQLTQDQTFVAREISRGSMTREEAAADKRRNMLLQCVGASKVVEPDILCGTVEEGAYMLCSDGFRHEISEEEILLALQPRGLADKEHMHTKARYLIDLVKNRKEKDNISVILIKAERGGVRD